MTKVTPLHSPRAAAPSLAKPLDAIQLHAQAENALSMALHYLRQPNHNVPGAARKTVQALASLNSIKLTSLDAASNVSGRFAK